MRIIAVPVLIGLSFCLPQRSGAHDQTDRRSSAERHTDDPKDAGSPAESGTGVHETPYESGGRVGDQRPRRGRFRDQGRGPLEQGFQRQGIQRQGIQEYGRQGTGRRGGGQGRGGGHGGGHGGGGHDARHGADREVFHFLLENHRVIQRTITTLPDGVETLTESDEPSVAEKIKEHVTWMKVRIDDEIPIRMRDPLFAELFRRADKIKMETVETEKGVKVRETSDDPYVVKLIQAHAEVVSQFVERGFDEAHQRHAIPGEPTKESFEKTYPLIRGHGPVFPLREAAQQPRAGTKLLVDLTRGGRPNELNPAIEKVAKYLNLYAGGGAEPVEVDIAIVFHGEATLAVLNSAAYRKAFGVRTNPNLDLLGQLHEAGVEMYVCGQALISKDSKPEDVAMFVQTSVSALTAVVNLQQDGYAYVPLLQ